MGGALVSGWRGGSCHTLCTLLAPPPARFRRHRVGAPRCLLPKGGTPPPPPGDWDGTQRAGHWVALHGKWGGSGGGQQPLVGFCITPKELRKCTPMECFARERDVIDADSQG